MFCEVLKCGVTMELGCDQEKITALQSKSSDPKGKCSTPNQDQLAKNFQGQQKL